MNDINLLPQKDIRNIDNEKSVQIFRRIALVILSGTALVALSLFILVIQSPLESVKKQEADFLNTISLSKVRLSRTVILNERLISIDGVLKERNTYEKHVHGIIGVLPSSVSITSLEITKKDMQINANTRSLDGANTFFNDLVKLKQKHEFFSTIILKSFALQKESGKYFFTINLKLI